MEAAIKVLFFIFLGPIGLLIIYLAYGKYASTTKHISNKIFSGVTLLVISSVISPGIPLLFAIYDYDSVFSSGSGFGFIFIFLLPFSVISGIIGFVLVVYEMNRKR